MLGPKDIKLDTVLSDYLDAELCRLICDPTVVAVEQTSQWILNLIEWNNSDCSKYSLQLRDNRQTIPDLSAKRHPRTSIALARIYQWAAYIENRQDGQNSASWDRFFNDIPNKLLKYAVGGTSEVVIPGQITNKRFELYIDLARTLWQRICYLSSNCVPESFRDHVSRIDDIYEHGTWLLTVQIVQHYLLGCQESERQSVDIDSDWLGAWLLLNTMLSTRVSDHYGLAPCRGEAGKQQVGPDAKLLFMNNLSQYVLYILYCVRYHARKLQASTKDQARFKRPIFAEIPLELSVGRSSAQLYVLSEYAYEEIGLPRELNIHHRLLRQLRFELPLYAASSWYRDHLYHVIDVCILGEMLLRCIVVPKTPLPQVCQLVDIIANDLADCDTEVILQNWFVASLFHDIGYVIEQARHFLRPVHHISGRGLDGFAQKATQGMADGEKAIAEEISWAIREDPFQADTQIVQDLEGVGSSDHGIAAWLYLRQKLTENGIRVATYKHALSAIIRHNLPHQTIDIKKEPLSLLLILCDHIQEWNRPKVDPEPLASAIMEALRFSEKASLQRKIRMQSLRFKHLSLRPKLRIEQSCNRCVAASADSGDQCWCIAPEMPGKEIEFVLPHMDAREGDFEPVISWLLCYRDLQCLASHKDQLWFDITISFKHTPPRMWHYLPWQPLELDMFERYAYTHKSATCLCDWIKSARLGQRGMSYYTEPGAMPGTSRDEMGKEDRPRDTGETFTINLHKLEALFPQGLRDDTWQHFAAWKWQWIEYTFATLNFGDWLPKID